MQRNAAITPAAVLILFSTASIAGSPSLAPMPHPGSNVGAVQVLKSGNKTIRSTRIAVTETTSTWQMDDGCTSEVLREGFGPDVRWSGCSGPDGSQDVKVEGSIWPMQVGAKVTYTMKGSDSAGNTWEGKRKCKVKGTETVTAPIGTYDTYHVVCKDPWFEKSWYISPDIGAMIIYESKNRNSSEKTRMELVEWSPGGS